MYRQIHASSMNPITFSVHFPTRSPLGSGIPRKKERKEKKEKKEKRMLSLLIPLNLDRSSDRPARSPAFFSTDGVTAARGASSRIIACLYLARLDNSSHQVGVAGVRT
jgi:hypothetical protein